MSDPSDTIDKMNHLDQESHRGYVTGGDKRQTADPADMASIMRGLEDDNKADKSDQRVRSTPRSSRKERRTTCDPSDMINMINHLDEESLCTDVGGGDRRQTADPTDMASIMRGLEDDNKADKLKERVGSTPLNDNTSMMSNAPNISVDDGRTTVDLEGPFSSVPSYAVASSSNIINLNTSMMSNAANISVDDGGLTVDLEGTLKDLMNEIGSPAPLGRKSKVKKVKKKRVPLRTAAPSVTYPASEVPSPWAGDMSMISTVDEDHTERLEGNLCDLVSSIKSNGSPLMSNNNHNDLDHDEDEDLDFSMRCVEEQEEQEDVAATMKSFAVGSSDVDYLNLMSAGGGGADMSVCSILDCSMDTSTTRASKLSTLEGMAMMRRLSVLNAEARINTLNQCGTPLAAKGSMSIGMKRHSLSVTQHLAQSNSKKHRASVSGPFRAARAALFAPPMHLSMPHESPSPPITAFTVPVEAVVTSTPPMHLSMPHESPSPPITAFTVPVEAVVTSTPPMHLSMPHESPSPPITAFTVPVEAVVTSTLKLCSSGTMEGNSQQDSIVSAVVRTGPFTSPPPVMMKSLMDMVEQCAELPRDVTPTPLDAAVAEITHQAKDSSSKEEMEVKYFETPMLLESPVQEQFEEFGGECASTSPSYIEEKAINVCAMRSEQEQEQEADAIIIACNAKKSKANLAGRIQLRDLRLKIEEAQRQLDSCGHTLHALQNEVSAILENKKDQAVSLLEQRVEEDKASAIRKDREAAEMEIMRNAAASELLCVERAYLISKQGVGLLNRLTYCRVLSYLSTVIELEAVLSSKLRVQLLFHLSTDKCTGKIVVDGTHVDLKYADANPVSSVTNDISTYSDRETVLADMFFSDVMCSDTVHGPLSEEFLSLVLCPADIPLVMRRVSYDLI